ncbi:MAG: DUF5677 domain-containing protein [Gammaproteobacteria bacterium]|nr:DUF5677 domain-containing protein [Gammaproteobacteria bacterium]MCW8839862.1 DUF5677 domain-containing protein [Gammaproteobacteria bacterium]MCW8958903.1 DUF5677 domain-containing protein [Gammaproteobacteria bacterium]MCW8992423.1 DUF5677 domain-containing protein [Gammaproteobacteria bacterium]
MDSLQALFEELLDNALKDAKKDLSDEEFEQCVSDVICQAVPKISEDIVDSLTKSSQETLKLNRADADGFVHRNIDRWRKGIDALEILISVCLEAGSEFNNANRELAVKEQNVKFDVVVRLHARACHISSEILWLIKGGFADAAQARWRALHEVVVTALFLLGHEVELSIRYLEHEVVESYKAMIQYNKYEPRLNIERFSDEKIAECKLAYDKAIDKYGKSFKEGYGWAAQALNSPRPNFSNLEEAVELDHLRPYYKWASQNIHANVHGIRNKLGLVEAKENILLAGPSNSGMTDPADLTALSLTQISIGLLSIYSNIDSLVMQKIIDSLSKDIGALFWEVECRNNRGQTTVY